MKLAPIVLFVYNRPNHTRQTLNALAKNHLANQSLLYVFADGPKEDASAIQVKNIEQVITIVKNESRFKQVILIQANANLGLSGSIINGVTEIVNKYGKVIVLEDDLVTEPFFLTYMNKNLELYENNDEVISIHGFMYPVKQKIDSPFFLKGADCWGWATWKRGWILFEHNSNVLLTDILQKKLTKEFNFNNTYNFTSLLKAQTEGKVDSWAIRWYASAFLLNKLTLYPPVSLVQNIGLDGSGTHKDDYTITKVKTLDAITFELKAIKIAEHKKNKKQIEIFFRGDSFFIKLMKKIKSLYLKIKI